MSEEKQLSEAEHLIAMKQSQGWAILQSRYEEIVRELSDIRKVPRHIYDERGNVARESTQEERMEEMIRREGALSLFEALFGNIDADIEKFHEVMRMELEKDGDGIQRFE